MNLRLPFVAATLAGLTACGTLPQSSSLPRNPVVAGPSLSVPTEADSCSRNAIDARHVTNIQVFDVVNEAQRYGRTPHFHKGFYLFNVSGAKKDWAGTAGSLIAGATAFALSSRLPSAGRAAVTTGAATAGGIAGSSGGEAYTADDLIKIQSCKNFLDGEAEKYKDSQGRTMFFRQFNIESYQYQTPGPRQSAPGLYLNQTPGRLLLQNLGFGR